MYSIFFLNLSTFILKATLYLTGNILSFNFLSFIVLTWFTAAFKCICHFCFFSLVGQPLLHFYFISPLNISF